MECRFVYARLVFTCICCLHIDFFSSIISTGVDKGWINDRSSKYYIKWHKKWNGLRKRTISRPTWARKWHNKWTGLHQGGLRDPLWPLGFAPNYTTQALAENTRSWINVYIARLDGSSKHGTGNVTRPWRREHIGAAGYLDFLKKVLLALYLQDL